MLRGRAARPSAPLAIIAAMPNRWKPNVTVAAIVEREGRFLFVEEDTADGLRLNNPAGHLDPGESPIEACVREVLEETAYDFEPTALVGVYLNRFTRTRTGDDITYLRFAFAGRGARTTPGGRWTMASCAPCGSRPRSCAAAARATAARWCCSRWRTTWPAGARRWS